MATKTVARGVVLVRKDLYDKQTISAVVSRIDAVRMQKRFGGVIVSAVGMKYRMAEKTLRVLSDDAERASVLATASENKNV